MLSTKYLCSIGLLVLLHSLDATAAVTEVDRDDFDPKATTFDFDTVPCGSWTATIPRTTLTNFGRSDRKTLNILAPTPPPAGCSFWGPLSDPERNSAFIEHGVLFSFDDPLLRVGFVFGSNTADALGFDVIRDGQVVGNFTLFSTPGPPDGINNWIFYGFEDPQGIDEIFFQVAVPDPENGTGIYDLIQEPIIIIDIKPGKDPNSINLCAKGFLSVAIFSSDAFDAPSEVDPDTVQFAGAGVKRDKNGDPKFKTRDVDGDGLTDMVLQFKILNLDLEVGETEAELTGETFGDMPIRAVGAVEVQERMCMRTLDAE